MQVLKEIKKFNNWTLSVIERNNGKIELIVTDWKHPEQKVEILPVDNTYIIAIQDVENKRMSVYISNHRKWLYWTLETYKNAKKLTEAGHNERYYIFIDHRLEHCERMMKENEGTQARRK